MQWLEEEAVRRGATHVDLDCGVTRFASHRFYHGLGYCIGAYGFSKELLK